MVEIEFTEKELDVVYWILVKEEEKLLSKISYYDKKMARNISSIIDKISLKK